MQDGTAARKVLFDNIIEHSVNSAWEERSLHSIFRVTSSSTCFSSASSQRENKELCLILIKLVNEGTEGFKSPKQCNNRLKEIMQK